MSSRGLVTVSLVAVICAALTGCQGVSADPAPPASGRGLTYASTSAPAGVQSWSRPTWQVGDQFVMLRGEHMRGLFSVLAIQDHAYVVDVGNGRQVHRDLDLGNFGEWSAETGQPLRLMSPVDVRYHWPLWVGKQWQCEFVDRAGSDQAVMMSASYEVEALDCVTVVAGVYDALRIRRTLRLVGTGDQYLTRTQMIWFAPDPGIEVRQLLGDTMIELVEYRPK